MIALTTRSCHVVYDRLALVVLLAVDFQSGKLLGCNGCKGKVSSWQLYNYNFGVTVEYRATLGDSPNPNPIPNPNPNMPNPNPNGLTQP